MTTTTVPTVPTVPAFVVLADSHKEHPNQELGLFYKVTDADAFLATLSTRDWSNPRIEPRNVPAPEVHPAHQPLFPKIFPQAAIK